MTFPRLSISSVPLAFLLMMAGCGSDSESASAASSVAPSDEPSAEIASSGLPTTPLIDPNTASEDVLAEIQGMSEAAVAAVVAARPFATPSELHAAIGELLTEDEQAQVYKHLFVKVGLNSGANDDYQLIPSSMPAGRLAHEFEEYRPYESMDQFRREMAKYVSDDEVSFLVRFVTLD